MSTEALNRATELINSGQMAEARKILEPIIKSDLHNVTAWFLLVQTVPAAKDRLEILKVCQNHNPDNPKIQQAIQFLEKQQSAQVHTQRNEQLTPTNIPQTDTKLKPTTHQGYSSAPTKTVSSQQPWYRTEIVYLLTFLFLTPVWSILILTDNKQKSLIKGLAGVIAIGYCIFCMITILPLLGSSGQGAASNVEIETFDRNLTPLSPYDGTFYGRVRNTGDLPLQFVQLRGIVKDANGQIIGSNFGFISSDILMPNATSQFEFYVDYPTAQGEECFISVESASFAP